MTSKEMTSWDMRRRELRAQYLCQIELYIPGEKCGERACVPNWAPYPVSTDAALIDVCAYHAHIDCQYADLDQLEIDDILDTQLKALRQGVLSGDPSWPTADKVLEKGRGVEQR